MNPSLPPPALIERLVAALLAAIGIAAGAVLRALRGNTRANARFLLLVERFEARGVAMRYAGENDATVQRRLDLLAWVARDPLKALKHMARCMRGHDRAKYGMCAPASFAPPILRPAALADGGDPDGAPCDTS